jgi:DNA invertase Pin-like site-specific DNA recombinase
MAAKRKSKNSSGDPIAADLAAVKRLLILQLITSGVQSTEIAAALGVDKSTITRLVPSSKIKKRPSKS